MLLVQAIPSHSSVHVPLPHCNEKALTDLTAVQKMQLHSWRVVILSSEYSQRHSLQVRRGSRANSPASDSSAVMVWGQAFPAEPIQSLMVQLSLKREIGSWNIAQAMQSLPSLWEFTSQIHKRTCTPKCTTQHLGASLNLRPFKIYKESTPPQKTHTSWALWEHSSC